MAWTEQDPGAGYSAGLRTRAITMNTIVLSLDFARNQFRQAHQTVSQDRWSGAGGDAFRGSCSAHQGRLDTFINALAPYSAALTVYASEIESIADQVQALNSRAATARDELAAAPAYVSPNTGEAAKAAREDLAAKRSAARTALAEIERERAELAQLRRNADHKVISALGDPPHSEWAAAGSALDDAGIRRPSELDLSSIRKALLDWAALVRDGHADAVPGLQALLDAWKDDPVLMHDFLDQLGGAGLVGLITALDQAQTDGRSTIAGDTLEALRQAFSAASPLWPPHEAEAYMAELVNSRNSIVPVAFLFGDPVGAPISSALAQAAADAIQDWETRHGTLYVAVPAPTTGIAADLGHRPIDEGPYRIDPADAIFRHLARDPQATLDWLADPTRGADRITYWYQQRAWHDGGGYAGPMLVWEALQEVPGGLLGPGMDPETARRLAEVNAGIINAWADPATWYQGYMDEEALLALAGVVGAQLDVWADLSSTLAYTGAGHAGAVDDLVVQWLGAHGSGWVANISGSALAILLAQIQRDPTASGHVLDVAKELQAKIIAAVGNAPDFTHSDALQRIAGILGLLDGAEIGNELSFAAQQDRFIGASVDIAGAGIGAITGTGGFAAGLAVAGAGHLANEQWAGNYDAALATLWNGSGTAQQQEARVEDLLRGLIDGWVPGEVVHKGDQSAEQYLAFVLSWYVDKRNRIDPVKAP